MKKTNTNPLPPSALRISAVHNDIPFIRQLILHKVPLNQKNDKGYTALHLAVLCGCEDVVELLLEAGANPNTQEKLEKRSPLFDAARLDHHLITAILLNGKANPDIPDASGNTPIICAAKEGHIPIVYLLARKGAKVDVRSGSGDKQGVIACMRNKTEEIAEWLGRKGAADEPVKKAGKGGRSDLDKQKRASITNFVIESMIGIIAQAGKMTLSKKREAIVILNRHG